MRSVLELIGGNVEFNVMNVIVYPSKVAPVYDVELDSVEAVESLVKEFYKFTRRSSPAKRPSELERVSVYHSVTPGTRIRISLLRVS